MKWPAEIMSEFAASITNVTLFVWPEWTHAIELLDDFVERNAAAICEEYKS